MNTKSTPLIGTVLVLSMVVLPQTPAISAPPAAASYAISFPEGNSKPAGDWIKIRGEVRVGGSLVEGGTIVWQRCQDPGTGTGAGSEQCESNQARWSTHFSFAALDGTSEFIVTSETARTIGWRFAYRGQGNGVKNGVSEPADAVWT